jgi:signal transduction histidine kinase
MTMRRRSVRMRLTILYFALFVASAVVLLGITNGVGSTSSSAVAPLPGQQPPPPSTHKETIPHQYLLGSAIALGVMAVVSLAVGWIAAGRILRPLRVITTATRRISADSLHERLAISGPDDELKDLADTIDELLERLDGAFTAQRRFVANASHELRTPLATIRALVDVAAAKPAPLPDSTVALTGSVRSELDKVDGLLDGLLALARAQHAAPALPDRAALSLDDLVAGAVAARAERIVARRLSLRHDRGPAAAALHGSRPLLARMVENLLDNAIEHNVEDGWIRVATQADGSGARLTVANGGERLDPHEVAGLAQPFRRLGAERTGSGTGLGLSIVAAVATAHGGSLAMRALPEGGLEVAVTLPRGVP